MKNIRKVKTEEEAKKCNELLTKLIKEEQEYNNNIDKDFVVKNWFENLYNQENKAIFICLEQEKIVGYIYVKKLKLKIQKT